MEEQQNPVDLSPLADDLTLNQIKARRAEAHAEHVRLSAGDVDLTSEVLVRIADLHDFVVGADRVIAEMQANMAATKPLPSEPPAAPVVEAPTPTVEAPVEAPTAVEAPTPAVEAVEAVEADQADQAPVEQATTVDGETGGVSALTDDEIRAQVDQLTSELQGRHVIGEGDGATATTETGQVPVAASMYSTTGSGQFENVAVDGEATTESIAQKLRNLNKMQHLMPGNVPLRYNIARVDRLGGADVPKLGDDIDRNTELLFHTAPADRAADMVAAAAGLDICGTPREITVQGCDLDDTTPFLNGIAGNTIAVEQDCIVRWKRPYQVEDVNPAPQLWTPCDQANVDPNDRSTWKPLSAQLPPCPEWCSAQPFDTIFGLDITLNDQICRPEQIEEMQRWISVFHAILLEQTAMSIWDMQVGPEHHFQFDASALTPVDGGGAPLDGFAQVGAWVALEYAVARLFSRVGIDRHSPMQGWGVAVHPSILKTLQLDASLAGERGDARARFAEMMAQYGVTEVLWTKDFGPCEGVLASGYMNNAFLCNLEACDVPTYTNGATGCVSFGDGNALPSLIDSTRMRFFQSNQWHHGNGMIVDYALHTSAELARQNRGEWFGERRDWLFKTSSCHSLELSLDVTGLCPTGQRIDHRAFVPCNVPVTGGQPPLAPQLSGAGENNPMRLADTPDPDPATTPARVGQGGPNPMPPTPAGTPVPGGTPVNP